MLLREILAFLLSFRSPALIKGFQRYKSAGSIQRVLEFVGYAKEVVWRYDYRSKTIQAYGLDHKYLTAGAMNGWVRTGMYNESSKWEMNSEGKVTLADDPSRYYTTAVWLRF